MALKLLQKADSTKESVRFDNSGGGVYALMLKQREDGKTSIEAIFVGLTLLGVAFGLVFYGSGSWLPPLASRHGGGIDRVLVYLMSAAGGMFLIGHLVLAYCVLRFCRTGPVTHRRSSPKVEWRWSIILGIVMALIAEGGVLVLALPILGDIYDVASSAETITIEVTGEQFGWNVRYPGADGEFGRTVPELISLTNPVGLDGEDSKAADDLLLLSEFFLPVDRPVTVFLRSKDVLHSFFLPHFRVKQDAVPGMTIQTSFVPVEIGTFELACAELCGFGHYKMRGILHIVSQEEYEEFLREEVPFIN